MRAREILLHLHGSEGPMTALLEYLPVSRSISLTAIKGEYETSDDFDKAVELADPKEYSFIWVGLDGAKRIQEALGELLKEAKK